MNKRILSILLCLMLVTALLVMAVPVNAALPENATITVTADKTNAKPGDDITFTVTLGPIAAIGSADFIFTIPDGMEFKSVTNNSGAAAAIGFLMSDMNDDNSTAHYTGMAIQECTVNSDVVLGTFTYTVKNDATGTQTVDVDPASVMITTYEGSKELGYTSNSATVTIGGAEPTTAPEPTEAPEPTTAPEPTPTEAPTSVVEPTTPGETTPGATTPGGTEVVKPTTGKSTKDTSTKDSSTKDSSSPKTGDGTHMYLWMLIILASVVGAAVVLFVAKRKGIFTK